MTAISHRIGDLGYDSDMDIVETMVRAKNNPDSVLDQTALQMYYVSKILDYWNQIKDYIISGRLMNDIKLHGKSAYDKSIVTHGFDQNALLGYETSILEMVEHLNHDFESTSRPNIPKINQAFDIISTIACGNSNFESNPMLEADPIRVLPNNIGIFGLNTYLYAYFERILLVGVPLGVTSFDTEIGCPQTFMFHDIEHSNSIMSAWGKLSETRFNLNKMAYYTIINDPKLTLLQKEACILKFWYFLHETSHDPFYFLENSSRLMTEILVSTEIADFDEEILKFTSFLLQPGLVDSFIDFGSKWMTQKLSANLRSREGRIANIASLEKQLALLQTQPTIESYRLLTTWFVFQYFLTLNI